jgi:hypothetical protein
MQRHINWFTSTFARFPQLAFTFNGRLRRDLQRSANNRPVLFGFFVIESPQAALMDGVGDCELPILGVGVIVTHPKISELQAVRVERIVRPGFNTVFMAQDFVTFAAQMFAGDFEETIHVGDEFIRVWHRIAGVPVLGFISVKPGRVPSRFLLTRFHFFPNADQVFHNVSSLFEFNYNIPKRARFVKSYFQC